MRDVGGWHDGQVIASLRRELEGHEREASTAKTESEERNVLIGEQRQAIEELRWVPETLMERVGDGSSGDWGALSGWIPFFVGVDAVALRRPRPMDLSISCLAMAASTFCQWDLCFAS